MTEGANMPAASLLLRLLASEPNQDPQRPSSGCRSPEDTTIRQYPVSNWYATSGVDDRGQFHDFSHFLFFHVG